MCSYQTTWHNIPEDSHLQSSRKSAISIILLSVDMVEQGNMGIIYQCEMSDDADCSELDVNLVILIETANMWKTLTPLGPAKDKKPK
jgi:hypothetical protein